jgi:hypothetical protein
VQDYNWCNNKINKSPKETQTVTEKLPLITHRFTLQSAKTIHTVCYQYFQIPGSVTGPVLTWNWTVATGLTTCKPGSLQLGRFYHQKPGISKLKVWLQISIWVLIVSWHNQYIYCAVLCALSPPAVSFGIWPIIGESRSKTREIRLTYGVISQRFYEYWPDRTTENGRWKSALNCTINILTVSRYIQDSNT